MGNECCTTCNNGTKQRELQDNAIKDSVNPTNNGEQLPFKVMEDGGSNIDTFTQNQKIVTNLAPDQSQKFRKASLNSSANNDRHQPTQNGQFENGATEVYSSNFKQSDQKRQSIQNNSAQIQGGPISARTMINTPNQNGDEVMVLMHAQNYDALQEIERIMSKFDNIDQINKDRPCIDIQPNSNEVYKIEKTGDVYVGEVVNKKRNGFGRLICQNGTFYEGYWENDKFSGQGFYLDNEGNYIKGQFKDNKPEGRCLLKKRDGGIYEGDMKNGEKDGQGEETTVKGMKYKGHFKNGKMHGEGQFVNDFIEGVGKCIWKTKKAYNGQWHENRMHGKGEFTWPDGKRYTGDFYQDQFDGFGEFVWQNGTCYKGQWKQGKMHGAGKITTPEGREIQGNWIHGEYQQTSQNGNSNTALPEDAIPK